MKRLLVAVLVFVAAGAAVGIAQQPASSSGSARAEQVIASWKAKPAEVARTMIQKYGQPQEVTSSRLVWYRNGPWKFSELVNEELFSAEVCIAHRRIAELPWTQSKR